MAFNKNLCNLIMFLFIKSSTSDMHFQLLPLNAYLNFKEIFCLVSFGSEVYIF